MAAKFTGGCACGAIRYEITAEPIVTFNCHCRDCQKTTVGAFPHAKRVGELLFLSGIGPRVRGNKEIPGVTLDSAGNVVSYDIETQCRAVFENVRLVLEDAGATWQDIIDVTVFLTNMKKD